MSQAEEHKLIAQRRQKLQQWRQEGQAFPNGFRPSHQAEQLQAEYANHDKSSLEQLQLLVRVAGRVIRNRGAFLVLFDGGHQIQLYVNRKVLSKAQLDALKRWDLGDIIGAEGILSRSNKGDLYVDLQQVLLLTKSLHPLPEKYKGLHDVEICYRQRYLDLLVNVDSRRTFLLRSEMISWIRRFLTSHQFIEVETPMMQMVPGGATAKPFVTHHNALDRSLYLRIAPELYLKRLVVGGFNRVFELNRSFRNEGVSTRHNPEFTMLEFYQAYADYNDLMAFTEQMLTQLAIHLFGQASITYQDKIYDLSKPFTRMTVLEAIVKYNPDLSLELLQNYDKLVKIAEKIQLAVQPDWGPGKIQLEIFEKTVEHQLLEPTFITEYPAEVSPLARLKDQNPTVTDRFELFISGWEIANGFSELNDAEDQTKRFQQQVAAKEAGDQEAMHFDQDYITALEYGLPPTAGEGIGIDRLVMLYTNAASIRDVILFPHMRSTEGQNGNEALEPVHDRNGCSIISAEIGDKTEFTRQ